MDQPNSKKMIQNENVVNDDDHNDNVELCGHTLYSRAFLVIMAIDQKKSFLEFKIDVHCYPMTPSKSYYL